MRRVVSAAMILAAGLLASSAVPGAPVRAAALNYSGDDISAGPGTMTIRCSEGERGLWELALTRPARRCDIRITRFDDLTDKADFSYAPPAKGDLTMLLAHQPGRLDPEPFTELHRGTDYYEYALSESYGTHVILTMYRISAATERGTRLVVRRTLVNISGRPLVPAPGAVMDVSLSLGVRGYDGRARDGRCGLSDHDDQGRVRHKQHDGQDAIWLLTDNLCRGRNPKFDAAAPLWFQAVVMDNPATRGLGLVPGRTFRLTTDIIGYYPTPNIGNIVLDNRVDYTEGLHVSMAPREWLGKTRDDHNSVGITADGVVTKTTTLDINIATK